MTWHDRPLRFYMLVAAIMLLVPLLLIGFLTTAYYASSERQRREAFAASAAETTALAFDAEIALYRAALRALAVSPNIASLSVAELQDRAGALFAEHGTELSITSLPDGGRRGDEGASENSEAIGRIQEDMLVEFRGSENGSNNLLILEAEFYDGAHGRNILRAKIPVARLSRYLKRIGSNENHAIHVYDSTGALIAGTTEESALSEEAVRRILATEGTQEGIAEVSADDGKFVAFWRHLPMSQTYLVLSTPKQVLTEQLSRSLAILLAVSSVLVLMGTLGAAFLERIMKVSQDRLLVAASAVGHGHRVEPLRTPLREINIVGQVLSDASTRLEGSAQALLAANERLERRIRARTRELHQKSSLLKATLDSIDQGIVHFDEHGRILLANRRCDELFSEQQVEEFTPRSFAEIDPPAHCGRVPAVAHSDPGELQEDHGEQRQRHPIVMERSLPGGTDLEIRKFTLADGSVVCSFSDISARVQHARELQRARVAAEEANRAKDVFLANMSHELRTPLNAVLGYADLLMLDSSLTPLNQERIRRVRGAGLGLLTVLNDVLDYSKIEEGTFPIDCVSFDILEVASDAISIVQPMAADKKLALDVDIEDGLPPHLVGDPNRIRQVMINLLNNAVKFTEIGFVKLSIQGAVSEDVATVNLKVSVEDSGIGIPLDQQEAVFERFYQVPQGNDALSRGTGLGLAICQQLVVRMGGKIWLRSSPEIGTIFTFVLTLPIHWEAAQASATAAGKGRQPIHILLADDVKLSLDVTEELLRATGVEVDCVADGAQAVEASKKRAYDLVILDINMPVMDGYEAAKRIRANAMFGNVPIVACSATPAPVDVDRFREASFDDYVAKPLDVGVLEDMLRRNLNVGRERQFGAMELPLEGRDELYSTMALVGPARAKAGLDTLRKQIDELIRIKPTDCERAGEISEIAHSGLASARLFGLERLVDMFAELESQAASGTERLSLLGLLQPDLKRMLALVAELEKDIQSRHAAEAFGNAGGRAPTVERLERA